MRDSQDRQSTLKLPLEPLTRAAFADFGDVIDAENRPSRLINLGRVEKFENLAEIDVSANGGRPCLSLFRAKPERLPMRLRLMERHPIASQAFVPLSGVPFAMVVARAGTRPLPSDLHAYVSNGRQGINYRRGTWHHPLIALEGVSDFLVLDRGDFGGNYDEVRLDEIAIYLSTP